MANPEYQANDSTPIFIGYVANRTKTVAQDVAGVIPEGTILGLITASGKLAVTKSASVDGSEIPRYVALSDIDATAGDVDVKVAVRGDVNENKLIFDGVDDLDTAVSGQTYFDWLRQSGIFALESSNLDFYDNN